MSHPPAGSRWMDSAIRSASSSTEFMADLMACRTIARPQEAGRPSAITTVVVDGSAGAAGFGGQSSPIQDVGGAVAAGGAAREAR